MKVIPRLDPSIIGREDRSKGGQDGPDSGSYEPDIVSRGSDGSGEAPEEDIQSKTHLRGPIHALIHSLAVNK
jgi:hypothetical protein